MLGDEAGLFRTLKKISPLKNEKYFKEKKIYLLMIFLRSCGVVSFIFHYEENILVGAYFLFFGYSGIHSLIRITFDLKTLWFISLVLDIIGDYYSGSLMTCCCLDKVSRDTSLINRHLIIK